MYYGRLARAPGSSPSRWPILSSCNAASKSLFEQTEAPSAACSSTKSCRLRAHADCGDRVSSPTTLAAMVMLRGGAGLDQSRCAAAAFASGERAGAGCCMAAVNWYAANFGAIYRRNLLLVRSIRPGSSF